MARVVFSLTSVQVHTLCLIARRGEPGARRDHTAVLAAKGWIARQASERWRLTKAGRCIVAMIRTLGLHKVSQASGPEKGGP